MLLVSVDVCEGEMDQKSNLLHLCIFYIHTVELNYHYLSKLTFSTCDCTSFTHMNCKHEELVFIYHSKHSEQMY